MQPTALSLSVMLGRLNIAVPESLSVRVTVPATKAFSVFSVVAENAAPVLWKAMSATASTANMAAPVLTFQLVGYSWSITCS